jgi:CRP-like cAMP-binding protein
MKAVFKTTGGKDPVKDATITFSAGEAIFRAGDLGTDMYIIQDGEVDIIKTLGGTPHVLSHLEKGDFFGEMAVLENLARTADAVAVTDVKLVVIGGARFDEMLRKNSEIAVRIIRKYSKRLREANLLLEKLAGRPVDAEVASLESTIGHQEPEPVERLGRHRLIDVATGTAFFFSQGDETTIGRADPVTGILPDIDLTPVDTNRSVSRRHAKIIHSGNEYHMLEEVGTVNGTFVNDMRIPTGVPVTIHDGDLIKIGLISFKAQFD